MENKKALSLHRKNKQGTLADRLGNGLQNRVEQFDSARYLKKGGCIVMHDTPFFVSHKNRSMYFKGVSGNSQLVAPDVSGI